MNYRFLIYLLGTVMLILSALMLLPMLVSVIYSESVLPFLYTVLILLALALPAVLLSRPRQKKIYAKEGFVLVALSWSLMSLISALPFVFSGTIPNYIDALFETVSGYTTTGASVMQGAEIDLAPRGIMFFRSFTHWIGGMGVLVFMLAILPSDGNGAIHIMRAEVPGPTKGKLVPRLRHTALILYGIYITITLVETVALMLCGLPLYDALVTSFSTTGTGGFSVLSASVGGYGNPAAEWVISVFMLLSGVNFNIYYFILIKSFTPIFKNEELKVYFAICLLATAAVTVNLTVACADAFPSVGDAIRGAFFQVTSIMSTTGFVTADISLLPELTQTLLFVLMFFGACAGSTAGGIKISRLTIIFKMMRSNLRRMLKPNSVKALKLNGEPMRDEVGTASLGYLALYSATLLVTLILVATDGFSLTTSITATVSCFNNVGPALGDASASFACFSPFTKLVLTLAMLFGRLEIYPMLILLSPTTWRRSMN
ncbi:MAG: TrkH family potassium uptake protein [Clostridia bacterium]|nr:TrkH family potassium uptake protein [Clostridia bacterium]